MKGNGAVVMFIFYCYLGGQVGTVRCIFVNDFSFLITVPGVEMKWLWYIGGVARPSIPTTGLLRKQPLH